MKTKEFIEMLQKMDPSGECHVRMDGGIPVFAEKKEGYWDGPYSYFDKKGRWVKTRKAHKVDIITKDLGDFIGDKMEDLNNWKRVFYESPEDVYQDLRKEMFKELFVIEVDGHHKERFVNAIDKELREIFFHFAYDDRKWVADAIKRYRGGERFYQLNEGTGKIPIWKSVDKDGNDKGTLKQGTISALLRSGWFKPVETTDPTISEWKLKTKGK